MSIRIVLFALLLSTLGLTGCHRGGVYDTTPRAVARAMRDDFAERECRGARGIDLGEDRWEVRGCGRVVVYSCGPGHRRPCMLERSELVSDLAGGEQALSPITETAPASPTQPALLYGSRASIDPALLAQLEAISRERQRDQTSLAVGLMVPGALSVAGGLVWLVYESLRGARASLGCWSPSGCGEPPPRTLFPDPAIQGLAVGLAGVGAVSLLAGGIVLGADGARHGELDEEMTQACTQVSTGAAGALFGLTLQTCFP